MDKRGYQLRNMWNKAVKYSVGEKVKVLTENKWLVARIVSHLGPEKYGLELSTSREYIVAPERAIKKIK